MKSKTALMIPTVLVLVMSLTMPSVVLAKGGHGHAKFQHTHSGHIHRHKGRFDHVHRHWRHPHRPKRHYPHHHHDDFSLSIFWPYGLHIHYYE